MISNAKKIRKFWLCWMLKVQFLQLYMVQFFNQYHSQQFFTWGGLCRKNLHYCIRIFTTRNAKNRRNENSSRILKDKFLQDCQLLSIRTEDSINSFLSEEFFQKSKNVFFFHWKHDSTNNKKSFQIWHTSIFKWLFLNNYWTDFFHTSHNQKSCAYCVQWEKHRIFCFLFSESW